MSILDFALQGAATALLQRTYMIQTGTESGVPTLLCVFDCVTSEQPMYTADITQHPVESGTEVTDHIQLQNGSLKIVGCISNTPLDLATTIGNLAALGQSLTSVSSLTDSALSSGIQQGVGIIGGALMAGAGGNNVFGALKSGVTGAAADAIAREALLNAFHNKSIFNVVTKRQSFKNMAIKSLSFPRDSNTGEQVVFDIEMVQVRIISTGSVSVKDVASNVNTSAVKSTNLGAQVGKGVSSKAASAVAAKPPSILKAIFGGK